MFSLGHVLLLLIREGVNIGSLFILVSLFKVFKYVLLILKLRNELIRVWCFIKFMDNVPFQCFTGVSNYMHVTILASLGWVITEKAIILSCNVTEHAHLLLGSSYKLVTRQVLWSSRVKQKASFAITLDEYIIIIIIIIIYGFTSVLHAGMRWTVFRKLTSKLTYL